MVYWTCFAVALLLALLLFVWVVSPLWYLYGSLFDPHRELTWVSFFSGFAFYGWCVVLVGFGLAYVARLLSRVFRRLEGSLLANRDICKTVKIVQK